MKNQMIKMSIILMATMLLAGCGEKDGAVDTSTTETSVEMEVVIEETSEVEKQQSEEIQESGESVDSKEPQEPAEPQQPAHQHTYTGAVTKEPGCYYARKDGEMTYTCACGDSYVEVLKFLPCSDLRDGIRVTVKEPHCQYEGRTCEHCKYCGQELYPGKLPKKEHVPSEWLEIPSQGKKYKVYLTCGINLEVELLEK